MHHRDGYYDVDDDYDYRYAVSGKYFNENELFPVRYNYMYSTKQII
jgi:hypothetical protein